MANSLILEGGQGSNTITDAVFHDLTLTPVGQVEVLEDSTTFVTVQMQTKDPDTLLFGVDEQVAGTGNPPGFGSVHKKGEYISLKSDFERVTGITLGAGSVRVYFT
ncbi:hypothetical protein LCGC14_0388790 [marine sediment metagenome]|uniref:Uncharacterized protein n=1 Tax=marine sediment metagenome TaxID=412755 RepID=A0A0F9TIF0_9ZZZZ